MSQGKYAERTSVPATQSRIEIERMLKRYGAEGFIFGEDQGQAVVAFRMKRRHYRLILTYPKVTDFRYTKGHVHRSDAQTQNAYEAEVRRLWRALLLLIKAKLEAAESGITTLEKEFAGDTIMVDNRTFYEWAEPQIARMYETGQMPSLIPGLGPQHQIAGPQDDIVEGEVC